MKKRITIIVVVILLLLVAFVVFNNAVLSWSSNEGATRRDATNLTHERSRSHALGERAEYDSGLHT